MVQVVQPVQGYLGGGVGVGGLFHDRPVEPSDSSKCARGGGDLRYPVGTAAFALHFFPGYFVA